MESRCLGQDLERPMTAATVSIVLNPDIAPPFRDPFRFLIFLNCVTIITRTPVKSAQLKLVDVPIPEVTTTTASTRINGKET